VKQSKIAIGSGGIAGKGFLKGAVTQGDFVPEQHTDFIFTALGENFGFWGTTLVSLIYFTLLMVIIGMAERQRSVFSRVYGYSVAAIIFFHVVVNICMTIGLAPVIGIPLPLISYGGSSLLTFTVLIFIFVRLDADRQAVIR
jgi:rod shape determining protein RodA